jgi:coenzyme F420-0:L-glutamate ligase/coenzyme F420-1:gamma-L-glutamate ligase
MANAGIDQSNVGPGDECDEWILLLPSDPDASAAALRDGFRAAFDVNLGVVITDSFGRAWRQGVVGVAIGAAGIGTLQDARGQIDRDGRALKATMIAVGDALAAAACLAMGEADESTPVAVISGWRGGLGEGRARDLLRPAAEDLFR